MIHKCPVCDTELELKNRRSYFRQKGVYLNIVYEAYVCPWCDLEGGTVEQVGKIQKQLQKIINKRG